MCDGRGIGGGCRGRRLVRTLPFCGIGLCLEYMYSGLRLYGIATDGLRVDDDGHVMWGYSVSCLGCLLYVVQCRIGEASCFLNKV